MDKFISEYIGIWAATNAVELLVILVLAYICRDKVFRFFSGKYAAEQDEINREQDTKLDNMDRVQKERAPNYKKINEIDHIKKDIGYIKTDIIALKDGHKDLVKRDDDMMKILVEIRTTLNIMREDKDKK